MTEYVGYPWVRQSWDTNRSYECFRNYLHLGPARSLLAASEMAGNSAKSVLEQWSSRHHWAERCAAYDAHMDTAATDGMTSQLSTIRDKQIGLADKLLDHLDSRLSVFIGKDMDPSMRWITAFKVASEVQTKAFAMREDARTSELMEKAADLLVKLEELQG